MQAAGRPNRWTDVCTDLCNKPEREPLSTFSKHLFKKFRGLQDALEQYGTKERSGSWKQDGDELGRMVSPSIYLDRCIAAGRIGLREIWANVGRTASKGDLSYV